ncbi:T9SS type A sorting domain-containing protein, partial [bacterium]|nr:T9SS type A sorting domain-containing protein [bacterium]
AVDGSYAGNVPPGTYDVVATHPSFAPDPTYNVVIAEDATTIVDFSLVDIAGPEFTNTTVLTGTSDTVGPYTVESTVTDYTGLTEVRFHYLSSAGGGLTELTPADQGGGVYQVQIPGQPLDTRVRYYFTATDVLGQFTADPAGGLQESYDFWVDDSFNYAADMETADGWSSGYSGDNANAGIWTRADPIGVWESTTPIQPEDDHTAAGTMCWITGNGETGQQGVDDVDGGHTTLVSPVFDLDGYTGLTFSYWRWFTNDTGNNPGEDEWVVQVTNGGSWIDIERTTTSERSWVQISHALTDYVSPTATVQFRFVATDEGAGGSVVEAGVDDFMLYNDLSPIDDVDPTVTVTGPMPGEIYNTDIEPNIEWTSSDNVGVTSTYVYYSADGGATWPYLLTGGAISSPAGGDWASVPASDEALIRIVVFDAVLNLDADDMDGTFVIDLTTGVGDGDAPTRAVLAQNHPNPFNPATEIRFSLPAEQKIVLKVYDVAGREVATLASGLHDAGPHTVIWRGEDDAGARVASGLYFYKLVADDGSQTRKMMLLK